MIDRPDLTALLGSRICHDLISPIGAIGNGVELMMMDGAGRGPEVALISESVAAANARIRFFRVAFGASSPGQRIGRVEVTSILAGLTQGGRIAIDWPLGGDAARAEVKLVFLAVLCLETAMAFGGRIVVAEEAGRWTLTGRAARLRIDVPVWELLSPPTATTAEITPALVHFPLLAEEAARQKRRPSIGMRETEIRIAF